MNSIKRAEHCESLSDGEEILQRRFLEQNSGFLAKSRAQKLAAIEDLARGRGQNAFHHFDGRRLAGAIRSEQAETDAFGDAE